MREPLGESRGAPSFASVVVASTNPFPTILDPPAVDIPLKVPSIKMGEPTVLFLEEDIEKSLSSLQFALVGKCSYGPPSLVKIREFLVSMFRLQKSIIVTTLDPRHVLLKFESEEDSIRVWLLEDIFIKDFLLRFLKWMPGLELGWEPSMVPLWISLPMLLINLYNDKYLRSIVQVAGRVIKVDLATTHLTRTTTARVCMEVDLLKENPSRVWVRLGKEGFWQKIVYENLPKYCTFCFKHGYGEGECKLKLKRTLKSEGEVAKPKSTSAPKPVELEQAPRKKQTVKQVYQEVRRTPTTVLEIEVIENPNAEEIQTQQNEILE
ncbi:PREDICTED: uncharacterized protein LOC104608143 [Nelumbo nucifera]|uniref:Uncharacterized protein LOC104608143 n=1 Tax=Nelumbo nucifera TaxID=4432 RepID=A0A1U8B8K9_NELNU|nr:PREDICTED: uncharacterized protein LOC104608143 [Nelumbo nucifera]